MGYDVDMPASNLRCKSKQDAERASDILNEADSYHIQVEPWQSEEGTKDWYLSLTHFQGDHWHNEAWEPVWLALAPHMADGAFVEIRGEDETWWRVRWEGGKVYEDHPKEVVWELTHEIVPSEGSPSG